MATRKSEDNERLIDRDLTALAREGKLSAAHGVDGAVMEVLGLLSRGGKHPLLSGDPGVGKSALVQEVARRIIEGRVDAELANARMVEVSVANILARSTQRQAAETFEELLAWLSRHPCPIVYIRDLPRGHRRAAGPRGLPRPAHRGHPLHLRDRAQARAGAAARGRGLLRAAPPGAPQRAARRAGPVDTGPRGRGAGARAAPAHRSGGVRPDAAAGLQVPAGPEAAAQGHRAAQGDGRGGRRRSQGSRGPRGRPHPLLRHHPAAALRRGRRDAAGPGGDGALLRRAAAGTDGRGAGRAALGGAAQGGVERPAPAAGRVPLRRPHRRGQDAARQAAGRVPLRLAGQARPAQHGGLPQRRRRERALRRLLGARRGDEARRADARCWRGRCSPCCCSTSSRRPRAVCTTASCSSSTRAPSSTGRERPSPATTPSSWPRPTWAPRCTASRPSASWARAAPRSSSPRWTGASPRPSAPSSSTASTPSATSSR